MQDFLNFLKEYSFIIGALTGSVAAFFLNLLVNYVKRERKAIGYSIISRKIVESGHKDLEIRYKGQPIKRLYSHQVTVRNVGNRALKELPVRIKFQDTFLEPELSQPDGATFGMTVENNKEIIVNCDLLERGEKFQVGFTSFEGLEQKLPDQYNLILKPTPSISVIARVENLECRDLDTSTYSVEPAELIATVLYEAARRAIGFR